MRLPLDVQRRFTARFDELKDNPYATGVSKVLRGHAATRAARVGDYRILFDVIEDERLIVVLRVAPRGQVYRRKR